MSKKIGVVSLGCDKNRVDTEKMLWYLSDGDYEVTADYADADIIIVNTSCHNATGSYNMFLG